MSHLMSKAIFPVHCPLRPLDKPLKLLWLDLSDISVHLVFVLSVDDRIQVGHMQGQQPTCCIIPPAPDLWY